MKKLTVWALLATLVVAGSAFAAPRPGQIAANATFPTGAPATTNNDDSCDISVAPAATLLLPYFEVDLANRAGENTIFTITNTSNLEYVAHITLWTDYSYPVIDFNVFLTGYDVQSISMYDVIALGQIANPVGTGFGRPGSPEGAYSTDDANPLVDQTTCRTLPRQLTADYITRLQQAFTLGRHPALGTGGTACTNIGSSGHRNNNAIGYATVDVASVCGTQLPSDPQYFVGTRAEALFDNVLIGDYQQVNSGQAYAQGNPMVHIRAIPEGGTPEDAIETNFDRTFYGRYQPALDPNADRRQPLPSVFAARYINGGSGSFETFFKIWREGDTDGLSACEDVVGNITSVTEFVTFDERENAQGAAPDTGPISPAPINEFALPETGLYEFGGAAQTFPELPDVLSGWIYMNLDNEAEDEVASQNWVVVSMRAEGRYSVDFDAAWLANGCTPEVGESRVNAGASGVIIGPAVDDGDLDNGNENETPDL